MKLSARDLYGLKVVDRVIREPLGGANKNRERIIRIVKKQILYAFRRYDDMNSDELIKDRADKYEGMGFFELL